VRDRAICQVCGACVEACPANAQEMLGQRISSGALVKELLKDRAYYEKSGGGVTLSGGEPSLQAGFALALLNALHAKGVSTALDTCGLCSRETLAQLAEASDLILYDVKAIEPQAHRRFTGANNERILENLCWLGGYLAQHPGKRLWVRTPLIPGATASQENLAATSAWLAENLGGRVERWELCAFNNLCRDKYRRLEIAWDFNQTTLMSRAEMAQAAEWARSAGFAPERIFVTGAARVEN